MNIRYYIHQLCKYVYPAYCSYCKLFLESENDILCTDCLQKIQPVVSYPLKITDSYDVTVFSIGVYKDPLKHLVLSKHGRDRLAARDLGHLLWKLSDLKNISFDYIIPMPLHWSRYAFRWYNQSEEMAKVISQYSQKPIVAILKKNKKTVFQTGLSKEERMYNVKNVFAINGDVEKYKNSTVLLLDDVLTTGATITSAVKALRLLNPKKIIVAVGCRVI